MWFYVRLVTFIGLLALTKYYVIQYRERSLWFGDQSMSRWKYARVVGGALTGILLLVPPMFPEHQVPFFLGMTLFLLAMIVWLGSVCVIAFRERQEKQTELS